MEYVFKMNPEVRPAGETVYLPPGKYVGELAGAEIKQAEGGEFPYISWRFNIVGTASGEPLPKGAEGQSTFFVTGCNPEKASFWRATWEAVGLPWEGSLTRPEVLAAIDSVVGAQVLLTIKDEEYEGAIRSRVARVSRL